MTQNNDMTIKKPEVKKEIKAPKAIIGTSSEKKLAKGIMAHEKSLKKMFKNK